MALPLDDPRPGPPRLLDLDAWEALDPAEGVRLELVEGVLQVVTSPSFDHQRVARRLINALEAALPPRWGVEGAVATLVAADDGRGGPWPTIRLPDVIVVEEEHATRPLDPRHVVLVAEVLSPGTRRVDGIAKLADYAEAGIEHYLLVDLDPVAVTAFRLDGPGYRRLAEATAPGTVTLEIDGTEVALDLDGLDRR